ncbi:hypothetical protein [Noviherbaspirillum pedocola]|uniref:Uncharacterized protein n=1 Tax=Noviherbaspirillum pedocola TaxID=2801341 RepID=A0A934SR40_9BURK|nr:hypothetical protein [Noviherbaspirillum pedocola]MBK4733955.1 hypothetical protein [Noviherbaspirillum pedocola]
MNTAVATTSYTSIYTISPKARPTFAALIAKLFMADFRASIVSDNEGAPYHYGM